MRNASAQLLEALKNGYAIQAVPQVIIDWNLNRYVGASAENIISESDFGYNVELFPIESIVLPNRPTKGINKARVGHSVVGDDYLQDSGQTYINSRFYVADEDDEYKYWTSPNKSDATGTILDVSPFVIYNDTIQTNKIVITTENTWATMSNFNIQVTTLASPGESDWTTVANQSNVSSWKSSGQIVLFWNGSSWAQSNKTIMDSNGMPVTTSIRGVRLVVNSLEGGYRRTSDGSTALTTYRKYSSGGSFTQHNTDGANSFFDLIEISARLEADISDFVMDVSTDFDLGEISDYYPIGTVTSNVGTLRLSNIYGEEFGESSLGIFNQGNTDIVWSDYLEPFAEVSISYNYFDSNDELIENVPYAKMYTEDWTGQSSDTVSLSLTDYSKFFNETTVPAALWENLTVPEIMWRVLDMVGFVDYDIDRDIDRVTEHEIPIFFTDGEQTVWAVLDDLSKAAQAAIYFNGDGRLQIKTRDFALSDSDAPVWTFSSEPDVDGLENIEDLEINTQFQPNSYTVSYQSTDWTAQRRGLPTMQKVWEPEGTVTLRSNPLVKSLGTSDTSFKVGAKEVKVWPYEGLVNIEGEIIRYAGKEFVHYTGDNATERNVTIVTSQDEQKSLHRQTPIEYRNKNNLTGALIITERGVWNSDVREHSVDANNFYVRHQINGNRKNNVGGFRHKRQESIAVMTTAKNSKNYADILVATRANPDTTAFSHYGTKFRFDKNKGRTTQAAGMVIHNENGGEDGYYIELRPSKYFNGKNRKSRNELIIYSRVNNKDRRIGGKGKALAIGENIDYEMEVEFSNNSGTHTIEVWVNGKSAMRETINGGDKNSAGRFGLFARGKTKAKFEYLYALARETDRLSEDFTFLDKVSRGYVGQQWEREWVYGWRTAAKRKRVSSGREKERWRIAFFDEFGPYVHEVREYDIKFDPVPVRHSRLYMTNDWSAICTEYRATPFGAKFILANTSRENAVINGEDSKSFEGTGQSVEQVLTVLGRALVLSESEEVLAENEDQIRRRGKVESDLSSQWIQTEEMADDIVEWMEDNFSYGNDQLTVDVFGNPLIELADVVRVKFPERHIDGDYFVLGINSGFDTGLTTKLTLRRRN